MKKPVIFLLLAPFVGCTSGTRPEDRPNEARDITVHVEVDTKGVPLGAYQALIAFDGAEATIVGIQACNPTEFHGQPRFNSAQFGSGQIRITGYSTHQPPPQGRYRLFSIVFRQIGLPRSPLSVHIERLYDTSRPPREITRFEMTGIPMALDFMQPNY